MAAFRPAVERFRTDMLELDVRATLDGEIVVAHDATLDRCTDAAGPISAMAFADLERVDAGFRFSPDGGRSFPFRGAGIRIPRLAEVLRAFPGVRLNVELKPEASAHVRTLVDVVRGAGAAGRVCLGSEEDDVAARLVAVASEACHFFPKRALTGAILWLQGADVPEPEAPFAVLDMPLFFMGSRLVDRGFLARAAARGLWVNVWTIDDTTEMRRLVDDGVGGIMTDRPDLLRELLG
jgi:glycerophosphoryl diester phosphodiesterase